MYLVLITLSMLLLRVCNDYILISNIFIGLYNPHLCLFYDLYIVHLFSVFSFVCILYGCCASPESGGNKDIYNNI